MGLPEGIFAASLGSTIAGTVNQIGGDRLKTAYERQQLYGNAMVTDLQAKQALAQGQRAAQDVRQGTKGLIGAQRAAMAAQGIDVNRDSALEIQTDTAAQGAKDAETAKANAWREAWGYRVESMNARGQASMESLAYKGRRSNSLIMGGLQTARDYGVMKYLKSKEA